MADIVWPADLPPYSVAFYLQSHTGRSESPFTRGQKVYGLSAPRWVARISVRGGYDGRTAQAGFGRRMDALLARLKGGQRTVALWDFRRPGEANWETLSSFSDETEFSDGLGFMEDLIPSLAAAQGATEIVIPAGAAVSPMPDVGDYVGGDGRPHIVTEAALDGSDLILTFEPPLAAPIAANEATFVRVSAPFRLVSDDAGANGTEVGGVTVYDLELIEDL